LGKTEQSVKKKIINKELKKITPIKPRQAKTTFTSSLRQNVLKSAPISPQHAPSYFKLPNISPAFGANFDPKKKEPRKKSRRLPRLKPHPARDKVKNDDAKSS